MTAEIMALRNIWQQAFGDPEEMLDAFFATGFSRNRCHYLCLDGKPVSALYWFDCTLGGQKLAYIYAVATDEAYRGKGLASRLMTQTHTILKNNGYAGALLVPGSEGLFVFYETLGYRKVSSVAEFSAQWADTPVPMTEIDKTQYARLRKEFLPANSVIQEGETLDFLATQVRFYTGEAFLLAVSVENDTLTAQELLGNAHAAPGILRALDVPNGRFRTPGEGRDFAMLLKLTADCPVPAYFGLALD